MFFVYESTYNALKKELEKERSYVKELEEKIEILGGTLTPEKKYFEFTNEFDFNSVKVVSVTRMENNQTEIGYLNKDEDGKITISEWYMNTDEIQHEKLVEEFKKSLYTKGNEDVCC